MTRLEETLDDLSLLGDRQERIDYLIAIAEEFSNPGPEVVPRTEETRVPGCESEAYIAGDGDGRFRIAVDNPQGISAMALAVLLERSFSGNPSAARDLSEDVVARIFGNELSMGKSMGLTGMVRKVKALLFTPRP
ncbi:MAG TPA: SufE family protein [Fimbriimonadaceae bacterium]|nr:SufE family protein [Fimbriimonadaceae bacterium]